MGAAQDRLAAWLRKEIAPRLREHGYKGSDQSCHHRFGAHWGVVNVQRSQWGSSEKTSFTINLGTASDLVLRETGEDPAKPPREWKCHWRSRLGPLVVERDVWWDGRADSDDTTLEALSSDIVGPLLTIGLPAIAAHADDAVILSGALEGPGRGWGGIEDAGILMHHLGATDEQRARFDAMVTSARRSLRSLPAGRCPAQGPKRTDANLARIAHPRADRRAEAAHLLGGARPTTSVLDALRRALDDPEELVRTRAAASLMDLGDVSSLDRALSLVRLTPNRFAASDLARSLARLAIREPTERRRIEPALRERLARSIGYDLVGVGVALEEIDAAG